MGTADAEKVHADLLRHIQGLRKALAYTIGVSVVTIMLVVGTLIVYVNHVHDVSNQRWCEFMTPLNQRYQKIKADPEGDPDAKQFADQLYTLWEGLGCNK